MTDGWGTREKMTNTAGLLISAARVSLRHAGSVLPEVPLLVTSGTKVFPRTLHLCKQLRTRHHFNTPS